MPPLRAPPVIKVKSCAKRVCIVLHSPFGGVGESIHMTHRLSQFIGRTKFSLFANLPFESSSAGAVFRVPNFAFALLRLSLKLKLIARSWF